MLAYLRRSFYLKNHPVLQEKQKYRENYCRTLAYFVTKYYKRNDEATYAMLEHYCQALLGDAYASVDLTPFTEAEIHSAVGRVSAWKCRHFKLFTYRFIFMTDCLFLCAFTNEAAAAEICTEFKSFFGARYHRKLDLLFSALYHGAPLEKGMDSVEELVSFWKQEHKFFARPEKTILVTATMSAGKSTLINSIVGKPLMRTSQEACTGHICRLYNKPFEDGALAVRSDKLVFGADKELLYAAESETDCLAAASFHTFVDVKDRICIIDTPGVNSAINRSHGRITKQALQDCQYDLLLYILNANQLGTEDEAAYLKYIAENVPRAKTVFVLNKLDTFNKRDDSIEESIQGVANDLVQLGYENPVILPISAYFSLLIKQKAADVQLDEDEEDEFAHYVKKYSRPAYDLTHYYDAPCQEIEEGSLTQMSVKCGLYGLETILFGDR